MVFKQLTPEIRKLAKECKSEEEFEALCEAEGSSL